MNYLDLLNPEQRAAVEATEGPVMIIAGAGSGKTRVLTYRIAHLMNNKVDPFNILALTFTNKASKEMRERIEKVVGTEARNLWMGTFHAVFAKILRFEADKIGYPKNFTIYDTEDSKNLIKSILKEMRLDDKVYKPSMVLGRISSAKNNLIGPDSYATDDDIRTGDDSAQRPLMHEIYVKYNERCFKSGAMDFDDLLFNTNRLLKLFPDVLAKYQHKFKYIMVDEYQDTNYSQYVIIRRLAAVHENICVVGDDAQSIYAFRGASIQNILNYKKDYPDAQIFKLEQNYRSTKTIVSAAGSIIKNNKDQLKKEVWTDNGLGDKIKLMRAVSDNEEGKLVAEDIFEDKMRNHTYNRDFAILYRTNSQSRSLEEALRKMNIPYKIIGGMSFYQRKEIKDLLAYLRLTINNRDEEALRRVINYPARGIGETTFNKLIALAGRDQRSMWEVLENIDLYPDLKGAYKNLVDFRVLIQSFSVLNATDTAYDIAMHVAKHSGILKVLYDDKSIEGIARHEHIEELLNGIKEFVEEDEVTMLDDAPTPKTLEYYLQNIALLTDMTDKDDPNDNDRVQMMTIHGSKGLEFKNLFVVGLEENLFPSQMSLTSRTELEEERRLFYVAITRAMKKLTLSFATTRFRFGNIINCEPSRFLKEIDPSLIEMTAPIRDPFENSFTRQSFGNYGGFNFDDETRGGKTDKAPAFVKSGTKAGFKGKPPVNNPIGKIIPKSPTPPANPNFVAGDTGSLAAGMEVEHQRFGMGKVTAMDGNGDGRKATIVFDSFGEKHIILKFAKLRIL
jgi:DNA helicase-2/ATP-dependent DNA helicase PcrA